MLKKRDSQRLTTGKAGGLPSPIRALLLAPLKGVLAHSGREDHLVAESVYHFSFIAIVTGSPRRGHSGHYHTGPQWIRSLPDPECTFLPLPHPVPRC